MFDAAQKIIGTARIIETGVQFLSFEHL